MNLGNTLYQPVANNHFIVTMFIFADDLISALPPVPIPCLTDVRFQRISGLGRSFNLTQHRQGGENTSSIDLPDNVQHQRLVMERGVMAASLFTMQLSSGLSDGKGFRCEIMISALNAKNLPEVNWWVSNALPTSWSIGEFDANANGVVINSFEFSYRDITYMGLKR